MKERGEMSTTLPNISIKDLNTSYRVGISQSSFDKFNKTMLQLKPPSLIASNKHEKKNAIFSSQLNQQHSINDNRETNILIKKQKPKKISLNMINIESNTLSEYKYVPPRRPKYIRCINPIPNISNNLSKSLPIYNKDANLFDRNANYNSTSMNSDYTELNQPNLVQFGDPNQYSYNKASFHRTPSQPLRMKIKSRANEAESRLNSYQRQTRNDEQQRAQTAFGNLEDENMEMKDRSSSIADNKYRQNFNYTNRQYMSLKYFCDSGDELGCFSTKVPVSYPESEKEKLKRRLRNSSANPRSITSNSSPPYVQPNKRFSSFMSLS